jgi:hypothetical protein
LFRLDCDYNYLALASVWQTHQADKHIRKLAADLEEAKRQRDAFSLQHDHVRAQSAEREATATQAYTQLRAHADEAVQQRDSRIGVMMEQVAALQHQLSALQQARGASPDPSNPAFRHAEPPPAAPETKGRPVLAHPNMDLTDVMTWDAIGEGDLLSVRELCVNLKQHYGVGASASHERRVAFETLELWVHHTAAIPNWATTSAVAIGVNLLFSLREVHLRETHGWNAVRELHRLIAVKTDDPFSKVEKKREPPRPRGKFARPVFRGKCHGCGEPGHFFSACPKAGNGKGGAARQL